MDFSYCWVYEGESEYNQVIFKEPNCKPNRFNVIKMMDYSSLVVRFYTTKENILQKRIHIPAINF